MEYIIIVIILMIVGVIILIGKGDFLIAGYNTASKEKKQKVNVKRLRIVIGGFLIIVALILLLLSLIGNREIAHMITTITILIMTIVLLILANTWCIKK